MTVKTAVSFTDRHHAWAKAQVEKGVFASVSAAVAAALEEAIRAEEEREAKMQAFREELERRIASPSVPLDGDDLFDRVRARIRAKAKDAA